MDANSSKPAVLIIISRSSESMENCIVIADNDEDENLAKGFLRQLLAKQNDSDISNGKKFSARKDARYHCMQNRLQDNQTHEEG